MVEGEPKSVSDLLTRGQELSIRLEKKQKLLGETVPAKIGELDPWTQTPRLIKLGGASAWLERSIIKVQESLGQITQKLNTKKDELLGQVQAYQDEVTQRRYQLAQMERLANHIPAQSLEAFRTRLTELESLKEKDPALKLGFQFLQEQSETPTPPVEQPPAATPEAESKADKTKRRQEARQIFQITIDGQQIDVMGRLAMLSLQALSPTSTDNRMSITDFAKAVYGNDDQPTVKNAKELIRMANGSGFQKIGFRGIIEGKGSEATIYLERLAKLTGGVAEKISEIQQIIAEREAAGEVPTLTTLLEQNKDVRLDSILSLDPNFVQSIDKLLMEVLAHDKLVWNQTELLLAFEIHREELNQLTNKSLVDKKFTSKTADITFSQEEVTLIRYLALQLNLPKDQINPEITKQMAKAVQLISQNKKDHEAKKLTLQEIRKLQQEINQLEQHSPEVIAGIAELGWSNDELERLDQEIANRRERLAELVV